MKSRFEHKVNALEELDLHVRSLCSGSNPWWPANFCGHTMLSPLLKKAEEKAGVKKDESPDSKSGSPPVKKLCTVYSKQLARLPQGDQTLVKEGNLKTVFEKH